MQIQSLSILIPTGGCVNKCKFCVSRMHENEYHSMLKWPKDGKYSQQELENHQMGKVDFYKRLKFARDNNCNTAIITGIGEPLQNKRYLEFFFEVNQKLPNPFLWIEMQTSGVMLMQDLNLLFLKGLGVDTISLSLSNIFDSKSNAEMCGISEKLYFDIDELCREIKLHNFNLRLSLNMTSVYDNVTPVEILQRAKKLGADQVTFRRLYSSGENKDVDNWVDENKMEANAFGRLRDFIKNEGIALEILPFGAVKYSYKEIGLVIDEDCMAKEIKDTYKYLILRENCRLYSRWDDKGSLIY